MALKDKAVSLEGLKAVYDSQDVDTIKNDVANLKSSLDDINIGEYSYKVIPNTYINTGTGNQMNYSGWSSSDFIPLTESVYTKITSENTLSYNILYDETKTKIKQVVIATGDNYLSSSDGAYIRFSAETEKVKKVKIQLVNVDPSLTLPYIGGDAKTIGDLFKRVVLTLNKTGYLTTLSEYTSDNTDDFNKINKNIFAPVLNLSSANKPNDFVNGFILSVNLTTGVNGAYQALFSAKGKLLYYRAKWAYDADYGDFISADNELNWVLAFRNVCVIGDSITAGFMPNINGSGGVTNVNYAWQNYVFEKAQITTCAKGGASARTFFTDTTLNTELNAIPNSTQCVVIYLGTNPVADDNGNTLPYGTINDVVESYDSTPSETWVGYYTKLIKTIQHNLPNTPIVVIGLAVATAPNETISLSATECDAIYVSASDYNNGEWNPADNNDYFHVTAIGYIGRANVFRKAINSAIANNMARFNSIQTITQS